jgi:short-subunit dehydrogenase
MQTAIVVGASSGIGREIAVQLRARGYRIGAAARNPDGLEDLSRRLGPGNCVFRAFDISRVASALEGFHQLHDALGELHFVYLVAGVGFPNRDLQWSLEESTLGVNCLGFAALATASIQVFRKQGYGHLVAVTSVAAVRPSGGAPAYGASKAFGSSYIKALRYWIRSKRLPIYLTEARPGFVDTAMLKARKPFWVVSAARAAGGIIAATDQRKRLVYVPHRWWFVAQLMRILPDSLYARIG